MPRPSRTVLCAFALVVLIGGSNFVAVRFSNRDLPPFWGAGFRFAIAGLLLLVFAKVRGIALPGRAALPGVLVFGMVNFGLVYAVAYWGLVSAPSALAATLVALVPLITFFLVTVIGMERFRWAGLAGACIALAGIAVVFADQLGTAVPMSALGLLFLNAFGLAAGGVLLKRLPRTDPVGTNAVAMLPGAALLIALAGVTREPLVLPMHLEVWTAFLYLATVGSIGLFAGVVYIVQRWTASASSFVTVLFPVVTVALGAVLAGELVSAQFVAGTALVMVGTYVGTLSQ